MSSSFGSLPAREISQTTAKGRLTTQDLYLLAGKLSREVLEPPSQSDYPLETPQQQITRFIKSLNPSNDNFVEQFVLCFCRRNTAIGIPACLWTRHHQDLMSKTAVRFPLYTPPPLSMGCYTEARIGICPMRPVDHNEMRLRAVVCLDVIMSNGRESGGSGWVTTDNHGQQVVVTAAHVLANEDGHARIVRVTAGKNTSLCEIHHGTYAAVHAGWYAMRWPINDCAVIKLDAPFNSVTPFTFEQTPFTNDNLDGIRIEVPGYPQDNPRAGFYGHGKLHASRSAVMIHHPSMGDQILHNADTEAGGPIIDQRTGSAVGLHTCGRTDNSGTPLFNTGVPINRSGNSFTALMGTLTDNGDKFQLTFIGTLERVDFGACAFTWPNDNLAFDSSLSLLRNLLMQHQRQEQEEQGKQVQSTQRIFSLPLGGLDNCSPRLLPPPTSLPSICAGSSGTSSGSSSGGSSNTGAHLRNNLQMDIHSSSGGSSLPSRDVYRRPCKIDFTPPEIPTRIFKPHGYRLNDSMQTQHSILNRFEPF
ncbi:trypsin-like cysteine/serine peptidase domain-containing protein [Cladorrhinum sp. PSN259]|nr:trypsin-like cysteine/serine peptidase domain-containing protein [Cladorrhinum sp. PSN259]